MSMLPPIPGFGVFNKPLPDALGHVAGEAFGALNWVKDQVVKLGTKEQEETLEVAQEPVCEQLCEEQEPSPAAEAASDDTLATHLHTSYSILLEERLQKQETVRDEKPIEVDIEVQTAHTSKSHKRKGSRSHHHHHHHHSRSRRK